MRVAASTAASSCPPWHPERRRGDGEVGAGQQPASNPCSHGVPESRPAQVEGAGRGQSADTVAASSRGRARHAYQLWLSQPSST